MVTSPIVALARNDCHHLANRQRDVTPGPTCRAGTGCHTFVVEYQLTAEVVPPAQTPALDALQRHGVAALLDEHLELLAQIEGPDGVEIEPVDHRIAVEPTGASITWVLDAPALVFAEDAARQVLGELLEHTELLADWSVGRCEVTASVSSSSSSRSISISTTSKRATSRSRSTSMNWTS